jgi:hypothetical protein
MKKGLKKASTYINQNRKQIDAHTKLLRNLEPYSSNFILPKFKAQDHIDSLKKKLEEFFSLGKVQIINSIDLPCGPIFDRYFSELPPFQGEKEDKKHEFPDAFMIASIERWCNENGQRCYALTWVHFKFSRWFQEGVPFVI